MNGPSMQRIAASVARERSVGAVLQRIVAELHSQPHVALTRIWLLDNNAECDVCKKVQTGGKPAAALHLVAGAGKSLDADRCEDWSKLTGSSRCIQLGNGKVGQIGATGESVFVENAPEDQRWSLNREWVRNESIVSFAGHPLVFRDEVVGVLVLFSRERLTQIDFDLLRGFADLAAIAIANARDFEETERRRLKLESAVRFLRDELDRVHAIGQAIARRPKLDEAYKQFSATKSSLPSIRSAGEPSGTPTLTRDELRRLEAANLRVVLEETNWKVYGPRGAAERLKMRPTTLASRLKSLGINKPTRQAS